MWVLEWLPNWLFYLIGLIGLVGLLLTYFIRFIPVPAVYMYKTPIQLVSILFICAGVFMAGAIHDNESWLAKVKELEEKVAIAEAKSATANEKIVEKVVEKTKLVREKGDEIVKYIDREVVKKEEVVKFVENCPIPDEIIMIHNSAALLNKTKENNK